MARSDCIWINIKTEARFRLVKFIRVCMKVFAIAYVTMILPIIDFSFSNLYFKARS